ncbi:MAG: acyl-CoA dehydrogenase family protein [Deltaproteobacteria bacterium]|nr:acyl-CoA dehydrogenase family protein [Deltaproteobacteria bacterium]
MNILNYTEDHHRFRKTLAEFLQKELVPQRDQWEEAHIVPKEAWKKMGAAGFLGTSVPEAYGGPGLDFLYSVIVSEELGKADLNGLAAGLHSDIVVPYIVSFGSEEQKKKYLPGCVSGDIVTAVAMTEPGAGSDVASIEMTAEHEGDEVVLNGSKTFISNGINCDLVIVAAKDPGVEDRHKAVSLYLVEDGTPGFTRGRQLEKMGGYSQDTAELFFSNCRIPKENLLGEKGAGFIMLMQKLQQERLVCAFMTVIVAELILEEVINYCRATEVDGKPLGKYQQVQFTIAEMATETRMNRALLDATIKGHMEGRDVIRETMMSKYASSESLNQMIDRVLDLFGDYGLLEANFLVKVFRDVRVITIFAGTTEVMKTIIAKSLGL